MIIINEWQASYTSCWQACNLEWWSIPVQELHYLAQRVIVEYIISKKCWRFFFHLAVWDFLWTGYSFGVWRTEFYPSHGQVSVLSVFERTVLIYPPPQNRVRGPCSQLLAGGLERAILRLILVPVFCTWNLWLCAEGVCILAVLLKSDPLCTNRPFPMAIVAVLRCAENQLRDNYAPCRILKASSLWGTFYTGESNFAE